MAGAKGIKQVFVTELTANDSTAKDELGDIRYDGQKVYKYIKYKAGSGVIAAVAGNFVGYTAGGYETNEVTSDVSDTVIPAGVLQAALTADYYGWIQIRGPATLTTALVSGATGNGLITSATTDGTMKVAAAVTDAVAAWATDAAAKKIALVCPM